MTLLQMVESLQARLPGLGATQATILLNDALSDFVGETRILWKTVELEAGADGVTYALPADLIETDALFYDSAATATSQFAAVKEGPTLVPRLVSRAEGVTWEGPAPPSGASWRDDDGGVRIGTTSSTGMTAVTTGVFSLSYRHYDATLAADGDTPAIPVRYHSALVSRVSEEMLSDTGDMERSRHHFSRWTDAVRKAKREVSRRKSKDGVRPHIHFI